MLTVACVLKGNWCAGRGPEYVRNLKASVERNLSEKHRFLCVTDLDQERARRELGCEWRRPKHPDWPGWWGKIEIFDPEFAPGPILFFDLDTVIVGPLDFPDMHERPFTCLEDFTRPALMASGMMYLPAGAELARVYAEFVKNPAWAVQFCGDHGDGLWMQLQLGRCWTWQTSDPGKVVSYKVHVRGQAELPAGARVVCFHGVPRPHEIDEPWMIDHWNDAPRLPEAA